uniref:Uncharacterized protein n=1 Tax=Avena sativa TaxID=4498 RepID=A0ACD5ZPC3_AVESA
MESSRPRGGGSSRPPAARTPPSPAEVKVKHIITRKVSADEASFKDVVHSLTGKDSAAARAQLLLELGACDVSSIPRTTTAPVVLAAGGVSGRSNVVDAEGSGGAGAGFNTAGTTVSFQDDTVLPSLDEMDRWWGSHHGVDSYGKRP